MIAWHHMLFLSLLLRLGSRSHFVLVVGIELERLEQLFLGTAQRLVLQLTLAGRSPVLPEKEALLLTFQKPGLALITEADKKHEVRA